MEKTVKTRMSNALVNSLDDAVNVIRSQTDLKLDRSKALRIGIELFIKLIPAVIEGKTIITETDLVDAVLSKCK
ncbi:MAG TPA: hypothetical protein VGU69_10375 [Rhizomicrobium sp.]|nr:hypothetical protein [Rhizomicrobium sp.]